MSAYTRAFALSALLASTALPPARAAEPASASDQDARITALVEQELAAMHAATADELAEGAPRRRLTSAGALTLPYGDGRGRLVVVGLAPGPPGNLPEPTGMEYLRFAVAVGEKGGLTVTGRPAREDLITAVKVVVADEGRALEAAAAALGAAKIALPSGKASWREALRSATYDARLPRERFAGEPGWHFIFDPWSEANGGYNGVLLDAQLRPTMVNGRPPKP